MIWKIYDQRKGIEIKHMHVIFVCTQITTVKFLSNKASSYCTYSYILNILFYFPLETRQTEGD